jgi:hypothetical protein
MNQKSKGKRQKSKIKVPLFLIFAFCLLTGRWVYADSIAENQARFGKVTGTVQVLSQGVSHWVDAHVDLPIEVGDQIHVDEDSEAELSITKNALWILQPDTDVIIGHTTTQDGQLTLSQGMLLGKFEPASNGLTGTWEFNTPLGVCAVRGTEFAIEYIDKGGTHLAVFKGAVDLQPAETASQTFPFVTVNTHQEGVLRSGGAVKISNTFSPTILSAQGHLRQLQKRFNEIAHVWSPLTEEYRKALRAKFVPLAEHHLLIRQEKLTPRKSGH